MADAPDISAAGVALVGPAALAGPGCDPRGGLAQGFEKVGRGRVVDDEVSLFFEVLALFAGEHGRDLLAAAWEMYGVKKFSVCAGGEQACLRPVFCPY